MKRLVRATKTQPARPAGPGFVWLLVIEHQYGNDIHVCITDDVAVQVLDGYVQEWWEKEMNGLEMPVLTVDRIEQYFERQGSGEAYYLTKEEVLSESTVHAG